MSQTLKFLQYIGEVNSFLESDEGDLLEEKNLHGIIEKSKLGDALETIALALAPKKSIEPKVGDLVRWYQYGLYDVRPWGEDSKILLLDGEWVVEDYLMPGYGLDDFEILDNETAAQHLAAIKSGEANTLAMTEDDEGDIPGSVERFMRWVVEAGLDKEKIYNA